MANDDKSFQDYFAEGREDMTRKAFPALSKFMDFSKEKAKTEDKASDEIEETEADTSRKRSKKSVNAVANEQVLDGLEDISEKLKIQSIVLVSQLEQATITNQLLSRLTTDGGGGGGFGGGRGSSASGGGGVVDTAVEAAGGASIWNYVKNLGKTLLGGAAGAAALGGAAAGSLIVGDISGNAGIKRASTADPTPDEISQMQIEANKPKISDNDNKIKDLQDILSRLETHLKLNTESEEEKLRISKEQLEIQKKIKDLEKENQNLAAGGETPNYGPWHAGGTAAGPIIDSPTANIPTPVATPVSGTMPFRLGTDHATHTMIGEGETPLSIIRGGGSGNNGQPARSAGGGGGSLHPSGPGGTRSTSGGRASGEGSAANKGEAWNFFKGKGYSDEETAAIMGNLQQESKFNPNANNPNDAGPGLPSEGIGQWNRQRRDNMMDFVSKQYGKPYDQLSSAEKYTGQLGFIDSELHTKDYAGALKSLKSGDYKRFGHQYEGYGSPPDQGGENTRENNATRLLREGRSGKFSNNGKDSQEGGSGTSQSFAPPKNTGEVLDHIAKARSLGLVNGEECVALAAGAVGVRLDHKHGAGSQVSDWRRGESASDTRLEPGTPVATFFDRNGKPTQNYAEGGNGGQPGADLDHAGVVVGYDKDGKGMTLADQWGGHSRDGKSWGGSGEGHTTHVTADGMITDANGNTHYSREHDIHSYAAIKLQNGGYLGGGNNPQQQHQAVPMHDSTGMPSRPWTQAINDGPENSQDIGKAAAEEMAQHEYNKRKGLRNPSTRDIGIQAHANQLNRTNKNILGDNDPTVAHELAKKSHEDAIKNASEKSKPMVVQQFSSTGGINTLTPGEKSGRLSGKEVGSVNPPPARLKELFTSNVNQKWY